MSPEQTPPPDPRRETVAGVLYAGMAFLIWGISPVYWKALQQVPALEIISHRTVWAFLFLIVITLVQKRWAGFKAVLRTPRSMAILFVTAILVCINWLVYVWAVNAGYLLQASLGYYINPLVNVMLGLVFLRERLSRHQTVAVLLAFGAVGYRTLGLGQFPWVSMTLGVGFGVYGLIRKVAPVPSLVGLTLETLWLTPFAAAYLIHLEINGNGNFLHGGPFLNILLSGTGVLTAVPLLFFNLGTRRINLSSVGLMQFISPSCMFLLAVMAYGEPFTADQLWTFALIWTALAIYSIDSVRTYRRPNRT